MVKQFAQHKHHDGSEEKKSSGLENGQQEASKRMIKEQLEQERRKPVKHKSGNQPKARRDEAYKELPKLSLAGGAENLANKKGLPITKTMEQLITDGSFADKRDKSARDAERAVERSKPHDQTAMTLQVRLQNRTAGEEVQRSKVDFFVHADGKIDACSNPEKLRKKRVIIEVERPEGVLKPTEQQQKRVNELVDYVGQRMNLQIGKSEEPTKIEDNQGLVASSVSRRVTHSRPQDDRFDEPTSRQIHNLNRFDGSKRGHLSKHDADNYFPERQVSQQKHETFAAVDLKDTLAGLFNGSKKHPYEEIRERSDQTYAVGRYGLTQKLLNNWLGDKLGEPPDMTKLPELMAQFAKAGKIPQNFAARFADPNFAGAFVGFIEQLGGKNGAVGASDVQKFLPQELQESVSSDLSSKFLQQSKNDAGTAALAWHLDKEPKRLTREDLSRERDYLDAARRLHQIAQARQLPNAEGLDWDDKPGAFALRIAHDAQTVAQRMNSVGYCYRGVKAALRENGINLAGGAAYQAKDQLLRDSRFREVSVSNLQPGDILVHPVGYANDGRAHPYGHIAVYLGNNTEASDHVRPLILGRVTVFRLVDH